jgi:RNA polymerase sigma factor (sigma-70 family)
MSAEVQMVTVNGQRFPWIQGHGLDPEAVLELTRFIWGYAWRYRIAGLQSGYTPEDLAQEGFVGALEAARRFQNRPGGKFMSYAAPYIHGRIVRLFGRADVKTPPPEHVSMDTAAEGEAFALAQPGDSDPAADYESAERVATARAILGQLPRVVALILLLFYTMDHAANKGISRCGAIGKALGLAYKTVSNRHFDGIRAARAVAQKLNIYAA